MIRSTFSRTLALAALVGLTVGARADDKKPDVKKAKPKVEVVFCLDTTGSMGSLIEGAKQKIWSIANQIAGGKPTPDIKIGLIAYRDRNETYVTQVFDLDADLDGVYKNLKAFKAVGGGDAPESVNQGLDDAVNKIKWSTDKSTLRIIFLVGDAPPHMDYADDVKYPETCKKACEKGIIINTIQCGSDATCMKHWKEIAVKAEGSYVGIQQDGGVVAIATPYDKKLGEINDALAKTTVAYGSRARQAAARDKAETARALAPEAKADRAGLAGKGAARSTDDLVDAIRRKDVKLEDLKEAELPPELQKLDAKGREEYLKQVGEKRTRLLTEARELDQKRSDYIKEELKKKGGKDSFDGQVLDMLRKQAKKTKIDY